MIGQSRTAKIIVGLLFVVLVLGLLLAGPVAGKVAPDPVVSYLQMFEGDTAFVLCGNNTPAVVTLEELGLGSYLITCGELDDH